MTCSIVHLSDLHLHRLPRFADLDLKRVTGAANLVLRRRRLYPITAVQELVSGLASRPWDHLVISGDLVQLGLEEEFELAKQTLHPLLERGPDQVTIVPGNHDNYAPGGASLAHFHAYFGEYFSPSKPLSDPWQIIGWDATKPNPPFVARGAVARETISDTDALLADRPEGKTILVSHYPLLFPSGEHAHWHHDLEDRSSVLDWVRSHPIHLYLHGHDHRCWIIEDGDVSFINSGTSGRADTGQTRFHQLELDGGDHRISSCQRPEDFAR